MDRLVELFLTAEKKEKLFDVLLCGTKVWPYLRLEFFRLVERQILNCVMLPVPYRQVFRRGGKPCSPQEQESYEAAAIRVREGCNVLVINNKHRMVQEGEHLICPITGVFEEKNPELKFAYCTQVYERCKYTGIDPDRDIDNDMIRREPIWHWEDTEVREYVRKIGATLETYYDVALRSEFYKDAEAMVWYVWDCACYLGFYRRLLESVRPAAVLASSYYATINMLIIGEARRQGIKTVEMQHGTIGNEHVAYNCIEEHAVHCGAPDYLLTYGQFERESLRSFVPVSRLLPVGNPFLERKKQSLPPRLDSTPTLLVISFNMNNRALVEFALSMKREEPEMRVIYRFHPEEKIEQAVLEQLTRGNVECACDFSVSIYNLICQADYCVGTLSTALYEALCFNKPSFVLSWETDVSNWREAEKHMVHVRDAAEFRQLLSNRENWPDFAAVSRYFYHSDPEAVRKVWNTILREE